MDRGSLLFLLLVAVLAALAGYQALFQLPASVAFARFLGLGGFMLLCVSLMLGPLGLLYPKGFAQLIAHRRNVGLASFVLVLMHFLVTFLLELGARVQLLLSQPSNLLAAIALVIMAVLALTSTDWAVKNVPKWKAIQRLAYAAFALSFVHFILDAKGLLVPVQNGVFVNLGEVAMLALGGVTVGLQVYGFYTVKQRQNAAKAAQTAPSTSGEKQ